MHLQVIDSVERIPPHIEDLQHMRKLVYILVRDLIMHFTA